MTVKYDMDAFISIDLIYIETIEVSNVLSYRGTEKMDQRRKKKKKAETLSRFTRVTEILLVKLQIIEAPLSRSKYRFRINQR